jgi:epoxyqueuosine reductase
LDSSLLVHVCCGACGAALLEPLRRVGRFAFFFYNPNIQPLLEFRRRLTSVQTLSDREHVELLVDDRYDARAYLRHTAPWATPARCETCWRLRLAETARVAAERGFTGMTTTLLASTHQDHEAVRRIGTEAAGARGLAFYYEDWRPLAERGHEVAKRMSLYRQQYCGCLFSEEERFAPTRLHLYRGGKADDGGQA